jgi:hypothetical protein
MSVFEKTVFVAQQEVGDVKDAALASESFARVSRRPPSDERIAQMRTLHTLIEEFMDDQANDDDSGPPPWLTVTSAPTPALDRAVKALSPRCRSWSIVIPPRPSAMSEGWEYMTRVSALLEDLVPTLRDVLPVLFDHGSIADDGSEDGEGR